MSEFIRIYLLSGLIVHKAVWEILKVSSGIKTEENLKPELNLRFLMKFAKIIILIFFIVQIISMSPLFPLAGEPEWIISTGLVLYTLGLIIAITGRFQLGSSWANIEEAQVTNKHQLVIRGIYKYIRHPIYTGDALLVLGLQLALNSWLFLIIVPLMMVILNRAEMEERYLTQALTEYSAYQKQTKMFLPYIF